MPERKACPQIINRVLRIFGDDSKEAESERSIA